MQQYLKLARTLGALLEIDPVPGCRSMAHLPVEERERLELERTKVLCNTKSYYFPTLRVPSFCTFILFTLTFTLDSCKITLGHKRKIKQTKFQYKNTLTLTLNI